MRAMTMSTEKYEGLEVVGYATKSELEPLLDETMPEGKHVRIGLDHPGCWTDDTPYHHLEPLCRLSDAQRAIAELDRKVWEWSSAATAEAHRVDELKAERDTLRQQLAELHDLHAESMLDIYGLKEQRDKLAGLLREAKQQELDFGLWQRINAALAEVGK